MSYNLYGLLSEMIKRTTDLAQKVDVSKRSMFIAGAVLAVIIGMLGYRLIKVFMGISIGLVGFFAGMELASYLRETVSAIAKMPNWIGYAIGGVLALVFMTLGFSKFSYAMFAMFALVGYNFANYYLPHRPLLAIAGAVVLALLSTLFVRFSFVLISSAVGGFAGVMYLGKVLPKLAFLQLGREKTALFVAIGISVFFFLFQYLTRSRKNHSLYG